MTDSENPPARRKLTKVLAHDSAGRISSFETVEIEDRQAKAEREAKAAAEAATKAAAADLDAEWTAAHKLALMAFDGAVKETLAKPGADRVVSLSQGHWDALRQMIGLALTAINFGPAQLDKRIRKLEAGNMAYKGVWDAQTEYQPGNFVTRSGSMWHAEITSKGVTPGDGAMAWRLAVKAGRPGKDAK